MVYWYGAGWLSPSTMKGASPTMPAVPVTQQDRADLVAFLKAHPNTELNHAVVAAFCGDSVVADRYMLLLGQLYTWVERRLSSKTASRAGSPAGAMAEALRGVDGTGVMYRIGYGTYVYDTGARLQWCAPGADGKARLVHASWKLQWSNDTRRQRPAAAASRKAATVDAQELPLPAAVPVAAPVPLVDANAAGEILASSGDTIVVRVNGELIVAAVTHRVPFP